LARAAVIPQLEGDVGLLLLPQVDIVDPDCVHGPLGMESPGNPACVQSAARSAEMIPDHACPNENVENNSNIEIRGDRCEQARLITSGLRLQNLGL
jgi:hypothetical protein